jgi:hypothetical protein
MHDLLVAQWEAARDEATSLLNCGENWDGEGARAVPKKLVEATLRLLDPKFLTDAPTDIYPAPDGTVLMEWHRANGCVHVANIRTSDRVEFVHRFPGSKPHSEVVMLPSQTEVSAVPSTNLAELTSLDEGAWSLAA